MTKFTHKWRNYISAFNHTYQKPLPIANIGLKILITSQLCMPEHTPQLVESNFIAKGIYRSIIGEKTLCTKVHML